MVTLIDWDEKLREAGSAIDEFADRFMLTDAEAAKKLGFSKAPVAWLRYGTTKNLANSYFVLKVLHVGAQPLHTIAEFDTAAAKFPSEKKFRERIADKLNIAYSESDFADIKELCKHLGYSPATVGAWLRAEKTADICALEDICVGLGVNVMEIWE